MAYRVNPQERLSFINYVLKPTIERGGTLNINQLADMQISPDDLKRMGADFDAGPNGNVVFNARRNENMRMTTMALNRIGKMIEPQYINMMVLDEASSFSNADEKPTSSAALEEAKDTIKELTEILERVKKDALILYKIDRMSKDKKFCFIKKGDVDLRIDACKDLEKGDEVLLHPKTMQIVERLGKPPLEASPFSPAEIPNVAWDDIGGLENAKRDMIEAIELPHTQKALFAHYKKKQIKGILLSGPPGCGKTMLGKAAANALAKIYGKESTRTGFLYIKGPEILNMYVGATEQTIRDIFYDAHRHKEEHGYPAIIFLDEADAILAARGSRNIGIGNTIVPMFLTEMDGLEESGAIVIIATNRPDVLDPAIVRDGRIDRKIAVVRPSQENAQKILFMNLRRLPVAKGHDKAKMAEQMAATIYDANSYVSARKSGTPALCTIINGAMLANIVDFTVSLAIHRDMEAKTQTGITLEDGLDAIKLIEKQQSHVRHDLEVEA